jgi:methyl-accepting chemotaxis protein
MQLLNNSKISIRMTIGFSILLLLMAVLLTVSIYSLTKIKTAMNVIVRENKVKVDFSHEMRFEARNEAVIIRNILLLRDAGQKEIGIKRRADARKRYQEMEDRLVQMTGDEKSKAILAKIIEGRQVTWTMWDKVVQLGLTNKSEEGVRFLITDVRQAQQKWLDGLDELENLQNKISEESAAQADYAYHRALTMLTAVGIFAFIFGAVIAYILTRSITRPLSAFTKSIGQIAQGDLTTTLQYDKKDELGVLGGQINHMTESFAHMITGMLMSANEVVGTVSVLKSSAAKTAQGAQSQSGQASQIATAAEEMSQTITDISKNSSSVAGLAAEATKTAESGREVTETTIARVNTVYDSTVELAGRVEHLNKKIGEISDIVTFIKGIADQTNLLALNAAIESARAGEQGRGFSVVADEVRKLAERTIKATTDISDKINAVQQESEQTHTTMGEASGEVTKAKESIANVGVALKAVVGTVEKVSDQIARIAVAVEEQSAASEDVAKNIEKTSTIAKDMENMAGEVTHAVNGLTNVAEALRDAASKFKIKSSSLMILNLAKTDHRIFVEKIGACVNGDAKQDPDKLPSHESCRFGKWYVSEGKEKHGSAPSFREINRPHEKIHALAKEAVTACNAGDKKKAEGMLHDMEALSGQIAGMLDQLKAECTV